MPISKNTHSNITTLTLNRPEKHNAFDEQLIQALTEAFIEFDQDQSARVLLLAAEGKSFCAGGDLNWMQRMANASPEENNRDAWALAKLMQTLRNLSKPTIACIQGPAYGGGIGLIACCDIALATPNAHFCLSEVKLGLVPAVIAPYVITAIGERSARRYFLTAEQFDANQAQELGLVHEVLPPDNLMLRANKLASNLLKNSPAAIRTAKQLISQITSQSIDSGMITTTVDCLTAVRGGAEAKEGLSAFFNKRTPDWASCLQQNSLQKSS